VLILLPASEAKNPIASGRPLDPADLSFPSLAPTRAAVLDALMEVSAEPDAPRRLGVPPTLGDVVRGNVGLLDAPAAPAGAVYAGVLYDAIGIDDLDAASRRRARAWIVIVSALWGAVRLGDRIPPYRLNMCGRLPGLGHLPQVWREPLDDALPAKAANGVIVDFRTAAYTTAWRPARALAARTAAVRVRRRDGTRGAGSYSSKRTGGLVVRRIVAEAIDPPDTEGLAQALSEHFDVDLREPARRGGPWELRVAEVLD
jgi:cytoplasmic iron level regulating protein YaaA (DUF328/UPF0246 family)